MPQNNVPGHEKYKKMNSMGSSFFSKCFYISGWYFISQNPIFSNITIYGVIMQPIKNIYQSMVSKKGYLKFKDIFLYLIYLVSFIFNILVHFSF